MSKPSDKYKINLSSSSFDFEVSQYDGIDEDSFDSFEVNYDEEIDDSSEESATECDLTIH